MTAVATHPHDAEIERTVNLSMSLLLEAMCMMTAMSGATGTPFKTAVQKGALIG